MGSSLAAMNARISVLRDAIREARDDRGVRFVLLVWLVSRAFFLVVGALGAALIEQASPGGSPLEPPGTLGYWAHWDGGWYAAIAADGYFTPAATSFFPLYPVLIWLGTSVGGGAAMWGIAISIAALLPALYFLYALFEELWDERAARAGLLAFAFFPSAFFLNAVYTESLFVMLTAGAIWALRVRRSLLLGCAFAYFAMLTRNVGILLLVPLLLDWVRRRRELGVAGAAFVAASATGLVAWMYYLWQGLGHPLYFAVAQRNTWGRAFTSPLETLPKAWTTGVYGVRYAFDPRALFAGTNPEPAFKASDTFNLILAGLVVALLVAGIRLLPLDLWLYSFLAMAAPVLTPSPFWALTSFSRYVLAAFPLFGVLGCLLVRGRVVPAWVLVSAAWAGYLTLLFVTWRWVA